MSDSKNNRIDLNGTTFESQVEEQKMPMIDDARDNNQENFEIQNGESLRDSVSNSVGINNTFDLKLKQTKSQPGTKTTYASATKSCFSPGSLFAAIVTCISGSMGTVMLNLPKAYAVYGCVFGMIVQTYAGFNTAIASYFLAKLSAKYPNANLYSDLVAEVLGQKAKVIFNIFFMITVFGVMIAMNLTANTFLMNLIEPSLESLFNEEGNTTFSWVCPLIIAMICITLMIPLQLKNSASSLKNISIFSIAT